MPKIENDTDKPLFVTARNVRGQDGETVTIEPGDSATIAVDGENQVVIATNGMAPGEAPMVSPPTAQLVDSGASSTAGQTDQAQSQLTEASDDQVTAALTQMRDQKTDLTTTGVPNLSVLNAKLAEQNLAPISGARRDSLWVPLATAA